MISVIIICYNSTDYIDQCLASVQKQSHKDFEVIIINNGNTIIKSNAKTINAENIGFAAGCNLAADHAKGEYLAFLNPDAVVEKNWLETLIKSKDKADLLGSTQLNGNKIDGFGDGYNIFGLPYRRYYNKDLSKLPNNDQEVFSVCFAGAFISKNLFLKYKLDETYFCYCEDIDFGFRLIKDGKKILQLRNAIIHHEGGISSNDEFKTYYGVRNRLYLYYKNSPLIILILTFPINILLQFILMLKSKKPDIYLKAILGFIKLLPNLNKNRNRYCDFKNLMKNITISPINTILRK